MSESDTKELIYCRKCTKHLSADKFYDAVDNSLIDTNMKFSVCKSCIGDLYDKIFIETQSMEKTIHRLCVALNVKFSNEIVDATKKHIETVLENGKAVNNVFGIYKQKITATNKSMNKSVIEYNGYEDVGTIFTERQISTTEIPIPQDVLNFWGSGSATSREDIEFLEREYANFKNTHAADTHAEITLLKQVCMTMLDIKKERQTGNDTFKLVKELQELMKNLAISPNAKKDNTAPGSDAFGKWIEDIEKEEPAQWLKSDPRGNIYRDVGNVEEYFQKYFVRPMKNFIQGSKDFNVDNTEMEDLELDPSEIDNFAHIDDGNTEEEV